MSSTLAETEISTPLLRSEIRPRMAKADLRKAEDWRAQVGGAIQRAVSLCGWTLKEFAARVDRDERQLARWINGTERPQLDALFAVEALRTALVQALAELSGQEVQVETTIRIRRTA